MFRKYKHHRLTEVTNNPSNQNCSSHLPQHSVSNPFRESGAIHAAQMRVINDGHLYKGSAFSIQERQILGIHGLLPPRVTTQEEQEAAHLMSFRKLSQDFDKYVFLMNLQDRNEKLFYRLLMNNVKETLPIIYTPTVGQACQKYGLIFRKPRGLFITIYDKGHIYDILCNWPETDVRAICVTDGERILGLGDLGAYGMGIPVGKLALYTACARVKPTYCLPITLDVGTNNKELIADPLYIGLRKKRVSGEEYDDFVEEFMCAVRQRYGHSCLIQFEDFGNHNAFRLLSKYRNDYCTFNDDIQGTAAVTVAGIMAAQKWLNLKVHEHTYLFFGAGEASIGIAELLIQAMMDDGIKEKDAVSRIWMIDSKGLLVKNRPEGGVVGEKVKFARDHRPVKTLGEAVTTIKPTALIGAAAIPAVFTPQVLASMASFNAKPLIFALSNPTIKSECTAQEAYDHTNGKLVFASGSPFPDVTFNGKTYRVPQCNNAFIFPGLALGITACGLYHVTDEYFLIAARELANQVTEEHLSTGMVFPPFAEIQKISYKIALAVVKYAYEKKMAGHYPEPEDKDQLVRANMYNTNYVDYLPHPYPWYDCNVSMQDDEFGVCTRQWTSMIPVKKVSSVYVPP